MKLRNIAVTLLIAFLFVTVAVWARAGQSGTRVTQWEYTILNAPISSVKMNQAGAEGWEAFAADNIDGRPVVYFKRPK